MPDQLPHERRIAEAVGAYPPEIRRWLLKVLASSPGTRAATIKRCYEREDAKHLAELLMDLEEDRRLALDVMDALRDSSRPTPHRPSEEHPSAGDGE
jgi:hypothetical protein